MDSGASNTSNRTGTGQVRPFILILFAACLVMAWQFIFPGYYNKVLDDAAITHKYITEFMASFREGILYPRWMPDNFSGYGTPAFVFYSPLLYVCSALLGIAGLGLPIAVAALKLAGLFTGGLFVFLFARRHFTERAALLAALMYTMLPTRILFLYLINTPAGRFGEAFMPMSLYFMGRYMEDGATRRLFWLAFSYAALILSHIATAYIFTPFLAAYGLLSSTVGLRRAASKVALGLVSGMLLSSFFFVPVLLERGQVRLDLLGYFYRQGLFVFNFINDQAAQPLHDFIGKIIVSESIMAAMFIYISGRKSGQIFDRWTKFTSASAAACIFMMTSFSYPVWEYVPGMHPVAFPYRFAPVYIIFVSVLLGKGLDGLLMSYGRARAFAALVILLFMGVLAYDALLVSKATPPLSEKGAVKIAEDHEMPEYLPSSVDPVTVLMLKRSDPLVSSADGAVAEVNKWGSEDRSFTVYSPRAARLNVKTFYFPGWKAWVDGKEVPLAVQEKTGAILMDVPAGRHEVALSFTDTPPRKAGKIISLLTLVALALTFRKTPLSFAKESGQRNTP